MRWKVCLIFLLWAQTAYPEILVFEYTPDQNSLEHLNEVMWSACGEEQELCKSIYAKDFNEELFEKLESEVAGYDVVNMSFGQVRMSEHELMVGEAMDMNFSSKEYLETFNLENANLKDLISSSDDVLFTAAAGNGKRTTFGSSGGAALTYKYQSFPASFDLPNLVTVAALTTDVVNFQNLEGHRLAKYSNFSVFNVDMASVTSKSSAGEVLLGTSFAAPVVARVAQKIRDLNPSFKAETLKEILMKSSFVVNIDQAVAAFEAYLEFGKASDLHRVHLLEVKKMREQVMHKLGDIMLVKSGGYLVEPLAMECARLIFHENSGVEEACLLAHENVLGANKERLTKLKSLWKLRGI